MMLRELAELVRACRAAQQRVGEGGRTVKLGEVRGRAEEQPVTVALVGTVSDEIERCPVQARRPVRHGGAALGLPFGLALDGLQRDLPVGGGPLIGRGDGRQTEGFRSRGQLLDAIRGQVQQLIDGQPTLV